LTTISVKSVCTSQGRIKGCWDLRLPDSGADFCQGKWSVGDFIATPTKAKIILSIDTEILMF